MDIAAMFSVEKERVAFTRTTNPKTAGGNVEKWLIEVEKMMKEVGCSRSHASATSFFRFSETLPPLEKSRGLASLSRFVDKQA
jgi:hypothetical protein